jgi:hypothetical protein
LSTGNVAALSETFTGRQFDLIRHTVAQTCTPDEFNLFIAVAEPPGSTRSAGRSRRWFSTGGRATRRASVPADRFCAHPVHLSDTVVRADFAHT